MSDTAGQRRGTGNRWLVISVLFFFFLGLGMLAAACTVSRPAPAPVAPAATAPTGGEREVNVSMTVSKPGNGTHFVKGERPVLTITLKDQAGKAFNRADDFTQLRLMASGPLETTEATTPVKLLNTTADRSQTIHHYVDLKTNTDVQVKDGVLTYKLQPVSDEKPGTYTAGLWAVSKANPFQQVMSVAEFQIGTATVEKQIVEKEKCASCHLGTDSGKFYFHHIDQVSEANPAGNFALDQNAVRNCKTCHNNEGYAAYVSPADGQTRIPDPIVNRVHGVHFGEELQNPLNTDLKNGVFKNYRGVVFPADVRNCTSCHVDDRWKTKPSTLACGSCHDNTWFGDAAAVPKGSVAHKGGPQANNQSCATCHAADTGGVAKPISVVHDPKVNIEHDEVVLTMSAPANGKSYVAGERPAATIVIKDASGKPIDHTRVDSKNYAAANFYVFGPRAESKPVLTLAAKTGISLSRASATNTITASGTPKGWTFAAGDTFKIAVAPGAVQVLKAPEGTQTPTQMAAWLATNLTTATVAANESAGTVTIASKIVGEGSRIEIYNSPVTARMGWKPIPLDIIEHGKVVGQTVGTTMEPFVVVGTLSTVANDLRGADPAIRRTAANITYQLDDVAGLSPGTYMAYSYANLAGVTTKNGWPKDAFGITTFQVGTATPEPKAAANCGSCHGNTVMHLNERNVHPGKFDPDYCKACHDYQRFGTGEGFSRTGGTSTSGWAGFGAKPIVARIHNVHRGAYLEHKEEVYAGNPNMASEIIFPQDIRNCTSCHDKTTSGTWKTQPSRLACLSCHDSDQSKAHGALMTQLPAPGYDPYGPAAIETCKTCHGAGREFQPDKVHNIAKPYKPPYPREE